MNEFFVALISSFRFAMTFPIAILEFGFGFFKTILWTNIGGIAGILFFTHFSKGIIILWKKRIKPRFFPDSFMWAKKNKKLFSKRNRRIARIKQKYGLPGIAAATPFLLSIPVGAFIIARNFRTSNSKFIWLFASNLFWSVVYSGFYLFFYGLYKIF